jgi:hypothetical protein
MELIPTGPILEPEPWLEKERVRSSHRLVTGGPQGPHKYGWHSLVNLQRGAPP